MTFMYSEGFEHRWEWFEHPHRCLSVCSLYQRRVIVPMTVRGSPK
jgi:hypothetical protein